MTACNQARLRRMLLESEAIAHPVSPLPAQVLAHLDTCDDCAGILARLRSAREAWPLGEPSNAEIERALLVGLERAAQRDRDIEGALGPVGRAILVYAGIGALCGGLFLFGLAPWARHPGPRGGVQPVGAVLARADPVAPAPAPASSSMAATKGAKGRASTNDAVSDLTAAANSGGYWEGPRGRAALVDGLRIRLHRGERARIVLGKGFHPVEVEGPGLLEAWSAPAEVCGWRFAYEAPDPAVRGRSVTRLLVPNREAESDAAGGALSRESTEPTHLAPSSEGRRIEARRSHAPQSAGEGAAREPSPARGVAARARHEPAAISEPSIAARPIGIASAWSRAARALDRNDFKGADAALAELCGDPDPKTKDAARLTRAKLWIAQGKERLVRPVLEDLARNGATPLVRRDARELLDASQ